MNSKDIVICTPYAKYLECIEFNTLQNGYTDACNLYSDYINSFAPGDIASDLAEFLQDQAANLDTVSIQCILENNDHVINEVSRIFFDAIRQVMGDSENSKEWMDDFRNHAHTKFDIFGKYYLFVDQYANAGCSRFIIQADSFESAYEILTEDFEKFFAIEEDDVSADAKESGDAKMNGNGTFINTDTLSYLGSIEFKKPK